MTYTVKKLAEKLGAAFEGDPDQPVTHVCGLGNASGGGLCYITQDPNISGVAAPSLQAQDIENGLSRIPEDAAIIVKPGVKSESHALIFADDPLTLHVAATKFLHPDPSQSRGIHETAVIGQSVQIGEGVTIDAHCVIYDGVSIGANSVLRAGVVIMPEVRIGEDCMIYPHVTIREKCTLGNRVTIHAHAVIGSDGHGYYQRDGKNLKLPQIGGVVIGDDVEIGSCTTVDRGRLEPTVIGSGVKLDNQVQIGHNVQLGDHALISAQSAIGGSTKVGHHLILGGQAGIVDHVEVGNHVSAVARTAITSSTQDGKVVAGMPSRPVRDWKMTQAYVNRLESLFKRVKKLESYHSD